MHTRAAERLAREVNTKFLEPKDCALHGMAQPMRCGAEDGNSDDVSRNITHPRSRKSSSAPGQGAPGRGPLSRRKLGGFVECEQLRRGFPWSRTLRITKLKDDAQQPLYFVSFRSAMLDEQVLCKLQEPYNGSGQCRISVRSSQITIGECRVSVELVLYFAWPASCLCRSSVELV